MVFEKYRNTLKTIALKIFMREQILNIKSVMEHLSNK